MLLDCSVEVKRVDLIGFLPEYSLSLSGFKFHSKGINVTPVALMRSFYSRFGDVYRKPYMMM